MRALAAAGLAGALASCAPVPPAPGIAGDGFAARLSGIGTEPFWSLDIDGGQARYATPERPDGTAFVVARRTAGGTLIVTGRLDGRPVVATVRRQSCSDGMSDRTWPMTLALVIGTVRQSGCAAPAP